MRLSSVQNSHRNDPSVPEFPDAGPVAVMDAQCSVCARGAGWIAHNDAKGEFGIVPLQSELGSALMRHYGMDPADPLSWLYLENGHAYSSLDAIIRVGQRLGGVWKALIVFRILPRRIQDSLYGFLARNRYRISGKADLCAIPDADIRKRIVR